MLLLHRRFATNMAFAPWHDEFTPDARGRYLTFPAGSRNRRFNKSSCYRAPVQRDSISNRGSFLAPRRVGNRQSKARSRLGHDCITDVRAVAWLQARQASSWPKAGFGRRLASESINFDKRDIAFIWPDSSSGIFVGK